MAGMDFLRNTVWPLLHALATPLGLALFGALCTYLGYWLTHRFSLRNVQFGNLHSQKMTLYPKLLEMVDNTIACFEDIVEREIVNGKALKKTYNTFTSFTSQSNVILIAEAPLAQAIASFNFDVGNLYGKLSVYDYLDKKGLKKNLQFDALDDDLEELKELRSQIFHFIRKEIGSGKV